VKLFEFAKSPLRYAAVAAAAGCSVALLSNGAMAQQVAKGDMAACRTDMATFCKGIEAGGGKRIQCLAANLDKLSPDCASVVSARTNAKSDQQAAKRNGAVLAQTTPSDGQKPAPQSAPAPGNQSAPAPTNQSAPAPTNQGTSSPTTAVPRAQVTAPPAVRPAAPGSKGTNRPLAACAADIKAICSTVAPGGGARIKCLRDNQAKLSPDCSAALASMQQANVDERGACRADAQRLCATSKGPERRACLTQNQAQLSPECAAALTKRPASASPKVQ
jgi:hypothetical protein